VFRETFASGLEMGREVLVSLGVPREVAIDRAQKFREHDERLLATQHLIYDDENALLETARQGRAELEQLFEADIVGEIESDVMSVASAIAHETERRG